MEISTTDVRYYHTSKVQTHTTGTEGRCVERREGVWASLIKDTRANINEMSHYDVRGERWIREDVTMLYFNNSDIASKVCILLKDLDYPSIPKVIAKVNDTTVVVEKMPQVPIMKWLESKQELMWIPDSINRQYLELKGRHSYIFRYK